MVCVYHPFSPDTRGSLIYEVHHSTAKHKTCKYRKQTSNAYTHRHKKPSLTLIVCVCMCEVGCVWVGVALLKRYLEPAFLRLLNWL